MYHLNPFDICILDIFFTNITRCSASVPPRYQGPGAAAGEGAGAAPEASRLGQGLLQRRVADGLRRAALQRGRGAAATRAAARDHGTHWGEQERPEVKMA